MYDSSWTEMDIRHSSKNVILPKWPTALVIEAVSNMGHTPERRLQTAKLTLTEVRNAIVQEPDLRGPKGRWVQSAFADETE